MRSSAGRLVFVILSLAACGCRLSLLSLDRADVGATHRYELPEPPPLAGTGATATNATLMVDVFTTASRYGEHLAVKVSPTEFTRRENARWVVLPGRLLSDYVFTALASPGFITAVTPHQSSLLPDMRLGGHVVRFEQRNDLDIGPAAVLAVAVVVRREPQPGTGHASPRRSPVVWQRYYTYEAAMAADDPGVFVGAMGELAARFVRELAADLTAALAAEPPAP